MRIILATFAYQIQIGTGEDQTNIAQMLNSKIQASTSGTYRGGGNTGLMLRTFDFFDDGNDKLVLPATFWHNDIYAPSQLYPTVASPWCPNYNWDGYYNQNSGCDENLYDGPWTYAIVAVVMADAMDQMFPYFDTIQNDDYNHGVFFASDANAADARCIWRPEANGWDCPGGWIDSDSHSFWSDSENKGSGVYAQGNPDVVGDTDGGGGTGCHFDGHANTIDQPDADGTHGNLVQDSNCQCNYGYRGDWSSWVEAWMWTSKQKPEFENRDLSNGGGKAPAWFMDAAACWMNNPRDTIDLQNALYWKRAEWNNQLIPQSNWGSSSSSELRKYWGWNEIPVAKWVVDDPGNWDAIIIKLPADVCQNDWGSMDDPSCLDSRAQLQLEADLGGYINSGKLVPGSENVGNRPGSYVLFAREYAVPWTGDNPGAGYNWQRYFFCTSWVSPNRWNQIVFSQPGGDSACYIDWASKGLVA